MLFIFNKRFIKTEEKKKMLKKKLMKAFVVACACTMMLCTTACSASVGTEVGGVSVYEEFEESNISNYKDVISELGLGRNATSTKHKLNNGDGYFTFKIDGKEYTFNVDDYEIIEVVDEDNSVIWDANDAGSTPVTPTTPSVEVGDNSGDNSSSGGFGTTGDTTGDTSSTDSKWLKSVGSDISGVITLDEGQWVKFIEADDFSGTEDIIIDRQQAAHGIADIITMWTLNTDMSCEDLASNRWYAMEQSGAKDIQGAKDQKIGDCSGYQVYGTYPDGTFLVCWYFETPNDNYKHYVAAEFLADDMWVFNMVQNNYSSKGIAASNSGSTDTGFGGGSSSSSGSHSITEGFDGNYIDIMGAGLDAPAKLGEWVQVKNYNATTSGHDICYMRVTGIERDQTTVKKAMDDYLAEHEWISFEGADLSDIEWEYVEYEVYFPTDWQAKEWGIGSPDIPLTIRNHEGRGTFNNTIGLGTTWEIGEKEPKPMPGDIWKGKALFQMFKGYDELYVMYRTYIDSVEYVWYFDTIQ